ncbi:hypothetical protein [Moraxella sp. ZY210820]|uniref:hypothetical protein n=1 Tax=unclassified Moraxella TaxID=2685852 RepID=UPI0027312082|nr:hypothetical protein [Moraxella sp. ZY210820]WLF84376.1 hypothetical protein LU301_02465 [Moraxella sp. ZY210820]
MFVEESEINVNFLVEKLRNAFFEISDVEEDRFTIKIYKYTAVVSLNADQKLVRITCTDRVADYHAELFDKLLVAVNEANASMINVSSYILPYEDDEDHLILLRVDQHISYNKGLILDQFVQLLRDFEEIDVHIFQRYMMTTVQEFEENRVSDKTLLN